MNRRAFFRGALGLLGAGAAIKQAAAQAPCPGIDPTAAVTWTAQQRTYTPAYLSAEGKRYFSTQYDAVWIEEELLLEGPAATGKTQAMIQFLRERR